jgi:membrane-bound metal-dependent hydrolase YbcI (DUF457 family)
MARRSDIVESMAIAAAAACLAHCVALPVLVAALPALATVIPIPTSFHIAALIFAVPTTLFALGIGYRHHRRATPLWAGLAGLVLLLIAVAMYERTPGEAPVTMAGSLLIVAAHLSNWRLRKHAV